ncbi:MAG TPA: class I SAM-dependent methyltransferase [candidate division WOR-3 bacterium]|uniref:Class I SAM-dependent methyltransferase n=1 Tax=candidate division WOR-3 bacterium TaxID=2052148 RepID=A0A7V5LUN8_UNCW3|nr:class I SAM-dependent methyltransferase [candidate division WOR-3 bacterium]
MSEHKSQNLSRVEIFGFEALFYEELLTFLSLGLYPKLIRKILKDFRIKPNSKILEFGGGTCYNDLILLKIHKGKLRFTCIDVSHDMIKKAKWNTRKFREYFEFINARFEERISRFKGVFDYVIMVFVMHGLYDGIKEKAIENAYFYLKEGGEFLIVDYNRFDVKKRSCPLRFFMEKIECPLAVRFLRYPLEKVLKKAGFRETEHRFYARDIIRFTRARK